MESYEIMWKTALPELEKTVSSISFDTYITMLKPVDIIGGKLVLLTGNKLFADTVSTKLAEKIQDALKKCSSEILLKIPIGKKIILWDMTWLHAN